MTEPESARLNNNKWPQRLIILFVVIMLLGFILWESILPIQIIGKTLARLTSFSMGLFGLLGLLFTVIVSIRRKNNRFSMVISILLGILSIAVGIIFILSLVLPDFRWYDTDVYRNGNDYLVIQEQETFVTTSETYPKLIRTTSPYSMIRVVKERFNLKSYDDRFQGNVIIYKGKRWNKEPATKR